MNTYIKLAWRNLWRNKKRTLIAAASVFFAVILALLMRSMQTGYYDYMIDASVRIQVTFRFTERIIGKRNHLTKV